MEGFRRVRTLSPLAQRLTERDERARELTEAWCRGMEQGGHEVSLDDYTEVFGISLRSLTQQARMAVAS